MFQFSLFASHPLWEITSDWLCLTALILPCQGHSGMHTLAEFPGYVCLCQGQPLHHQTCGAFSMSSVGGLLSPKPGCLCLCRSPILTKLHSSSLCGLCNVDIPLWASEPDSQLVTLAQFFSTPPNSFLQTHWTLHANPVLQLEPNACKNRLPTYPQYFHITS